MKKHFLTFFLSVLLLLYHLPELLTWGQTRTAFSVPSFLATTDFRIQDFRFLKLPTLLVDWKRLNSNSEALFKQSARALKRALGEQAPESFFVKQGDMTRHYPRKEIRLLYRPIAEKASKRMLESWESGIRELDAKGVTVFVLPVPSRVSIEKMTHLKQARLPSSNIWNSKKQVEIEASKENYQRILNAFQGKAIDLYTPMLSHIIKGGKEELFPPDDWHWSSFGASLSAKEILLRLPIPETRKKELQLKFVGNKPQAAVTKNIAFYEKWMPSTLLNFTSFRWEEPLFELEPKGLGEGKRRVFVGGTSFSGRLAEKGLDLPSLLRRSLGWKTQQVHFGAMGLDGGLKKMQKQGIELAKGDILIWEFPIINFYEENPLF